MSTQPVDDDQLELFEPLQFDDTNAEQEEVESDAS